MINITNKEKCCGCTACYSVCPKNCISMEPDEEGFLYPKVDKNICVNCGLCEKICPVISTEKKVDVNPRTVVIQNVNDIVLKKSTSGGMIDALSKYVIQKNGFVVGVSYDDNFLPQHEIVNTYKSTTAFCGSKYAQSRLDDVFRKILSLLDKEQLILFIGTPCQVAGLKSYIGKEYNKLITVDIVCRSVPSPLLLKSYLDWQTSRFNSEISSINFRNKTYGYHNGTLTIQFKNGKTYSGSNRVDLYMKAFHNDICSRPSCYDCKFKTLNRTSDFTVFDCWNPDIVTNYTIKDNNKGYSNVFLQTEKAEYILKQLQTVRIWPANTDLVCKYTGNMESESIMMKENRKKFYHVLNAEGFESCLKQFISVTFIDRILEKSKTLLYKTGLLSKIKRR